MYNVFTQLLNMSLTAGIMVGAVILIRLFLKKAPRKYVCILWAFVALRLICPISISGSFSFYNLLNINTGPAGQIEYFQYNGKTEKPEILFDIPALVNDNLSPESATIGEHTADVYLPTVISIWLFGVTIMLVYAMISYIRLKKETSASIHFMDNIYVCDEIRSPFIIGIRRPRIYLRSGMKDEVKKHVILHEQAHIKRHDHWWKPLGYTLLSIYWFNPMLWIAYILFCRDIEAACDEMVIAEMNKADIAEYSDALLACALQRHMITVCPAAFGETNVKNRVKNILNYKKASFRVVCAAVIACVVGVICFMTNPTGTAADYIRLNNTMSLQTNYACFETKLDGQNVAAIVAERWSEGQCISTDPITLTSSSERFVLYLTPERSGGSVTGVTVQMQTGGSDAQVEGFVLPAHWTVQGWSVLYTDRDKVIPLKAGEEKIIAAIVFDVGNGISVFNCETFEEEPEKLQKADFTIVIRAFLQGSRREVWAGNQSQRDHI